MFTGIVQEIAEVVFLFKKGDLLTFTLRLSKKRILGLKRGASLAVNGVCLTVVKIKGDAVTFDAMKETLKRTTLSLLKKGNRVNIERSAKLGDEIGGHLLSGHIIGKTKILKKEGNVLFFHLPKDLEKYFFSKGYIAIDGISLTLVDVNQKKGFFTVHLIPETKKRTTLMDKSVGKEVNLEIDSMTMAVVDTTLSFLANRS